MPHYDFKKDFAIAQKTEHEVAKLLEDTYGLSILGFNNNYKYDILLKSTEGKKFTIEVKEDFICETTGNVGLEFECRGKLSGISISEVDYYLYKLHTRDYGIIFVVQKTKMLKQKISDEKYFRIVNGGDEGSNSMNYLFKLREFTNGAVRIVRK